MAAGSGVEKDGLVVTLEVDIEHVAAESVLLAIASRDQSVMPVGRYEAEDGIAVIRRFVVEVDAGEQPLEDAAGENADVDVRGMVEVSGRGDDARLDVRKRKTPSGVSERPKPLKCALASASEAPG